MVKQINHATLYFNLNSKFLTLVSIATIFKNSVLIVIVYNSGDFNHFQFLRRNVFMRTLNIWWDNKKVGTLSQDAGRLLDFKYSSAWLKNDDLNALSVSLPKRERRFNTKECRPFFAGLLPEQNQRSIIARNLGVSKNNDFSLLEKLGEDVAGILQILPPNLKPSEISNKSQTKYLTTEELAKKIDDLPIQPLLSGDSELRVSLAGAQSKVPVVLIDGKIGLPIGGQPTTHILKPAMSEYPASTENEAFVMLLARSVKLDVADVEPMSVLGRTFLLVKRYDRIICKNSIVKRLHQEDFCQALGITPENKYASEGGPGLSDCFKLIRNQSITPVADIKKFLDAVIFNLIVGNADAHGKNFSLLYGERGPCLAPLYDLLSTAAYPKLTSNFAMRIGKRRTLDEIDKRSWNRLAKSNEIEFTYIKDRVIELCDSILSQLKKVSKELQRNEFDNIAISNFESIIENRSNLCKKTV